MIAFKNLPNLPLPYEIMLAGSIFLLVLAALYFLKAFALRQLRRIATGSRFEFLGYPVQIIDATGFPFLAGVALLAALSQLDLPARYAKWLHYAWIIVLMFQLAVWANRIVSILVERAFERHRAKDPSGATHLMVLGLIARIVLWSMAVLITLDNLGFNITTLVASLGIGGIAVALAVQNILGDIFSSISIAMDKPFVIGDFIVVDDYMGTVEYVGLKTTRIRSLGGEQIIFSNAELLKNRIRNFKRMQERRVVYEFGIAYETPIEQVEHIPLLVKQIITSNEAAIRFDRAHFKGYGESALLFEAVYFVLDPDFNKHMDIQQAINLALLREFRKRGVAFAYPSRTVFLNTAPQQTSSEKKGGTARVVVMNEASMTEHQADRNERAMESGSAPQRTLRTPD